MRKSTDWSRRDFLAAVAGAGAATLLRPVEALASDQSDKRVEVLEVDKRMVALMARTLGIDTHNHIDPLLTAAAVLGPDIDLAGEIKRSGFSAVCATFAVDYQRLGQPGVAYDRFMNALESMDAQLARNHMRRALNLKDLKAAHAKGQPTVVQSVEGGHFLEGKLERLQGAYAKGLRVLCLLHDSDASTPLGDLYTAPAHLGGLTEFGAKVIKECNRLGIVVDLTHASADTVAAALKVSTRPVLFSHTGLDTRLGGNERMGQMMRPRLISREHAKTIADAGGVIGVWTHLVDSPAEYVQAARDMVNVVGADHVCIGTDTKITQGNARGDPGGGPGQAGRAPNGDDSWPRGSGGPAGGPGGEPRGPGGRPGRGGVGDRTNQAWADQKMGFFYSVVGEMVKQGFTDDEIGKIGGRNFCRVFDAATSGHS